MVYVHDLNPVLFSLGPFEVRWYGVFYVLTFVIGYFFLIHLAKKRDIPITKEDAADVLLYELLGTIIGARLFYVFVYNFQLFLDNPLSLFFIWQGGLSFHGGFIGAVVAGLLFCKKKKIHPYDLADILVVPLALGLALGRVGNFINGELPGRVTSVSWAVEFSGYEGARHPSQLYSVFKNLAAFGVLLYLSTKKLPRGILFWSFVLLYSSFRFIVEFFREPDAQLGYVIGIFSMGQVLSVVFFLVGLFFMVRILKRN